MKIEKTNIDHIDLAYEIPTPGISLCQFEEGITKQTNEKSGKTTLRLPMVIIKVIDGDDGNEGRKMSHFVPIETDFGEKQINGILNLTGLADTFATKYKGDLSPLEDGFINHLKLKLPGKQVKVHHDLRKDQKGKDQVNISRFEMVDGAASKPASKPTAAKGEGKAGEEDW